MEAQGGSSREAEGFSALELKSAFLDAMNKQHIKNIPVRAPVIKAMAWLKKIMRLFLSLRIGLAGKMSKRSGQPRLSGQGRRLSAKKTVRNPGGRIWSPSRPSS